METTANGLSKLLDGRATIGRGVVEKMLKETVAPTKPDPNMLAKLGVFSVLWSSSIRLFRYCNIPQLKIVRT